MYCSDYILGMVVVWDLKVLEGTDKLKITSYREVLSK